MSGGMDCCFNCGSEGSRCICCRKCGTKYGQIDCPVCKTMVPKKPIKKQAQVKPKPPTQEEIDDTIGDLLTDCWNRIVELNGSDIKTIEAFHGYTASSIEVSLEYHKDAKRSKDDVTRLYEMLGKYKFIGDL